MARVDTFSQKQKPRLAKNTSLVTLSIATVTILSISLFAESVLKLPIPGVPDHVRGIGDVQGAENIPLETSGVTAGDESVWPQKVNVPALASTASSTPAFAGIAEEISGNLRISTVKLSYSSAGLAQLPQNMSSVMPVVDGVGVQLPPVGVPPAQETPPFTPPDERPPVPLPPQPTDPPIPPVPDPGVVVPDPTTAPPTTSL
jgi:hypothetical protein